MEPFLLMTAAGGKEDSFQLCSTRSNKCRPPHNHNVLDLTSFHRPNEEVHCRVVGSGKVE